jgi:drug/metabolite transporter (DMT)-like permease
MTHILGIIALNIFPSVLAYQFWNRALRSVSANEVAISQYLIPIFTTLISLAFLDERLHSFHLVGGGLVFLGVFLVTTPRLHRNTLGK